MIRHHGKLTPLHLGRDYAVLYQPRFTVKGPDTGLEYDLDVSIAEEDGRLVCESFHATRRPGGPPVTAEGLARLPVVGIVARAADGFGVVRLEQKRGGTNIKPVVDLSKLDELERVAVLYRRAFAIGYPPTRAVAEGLDVSSAVAAKRVQAARRAGFLDPTSPGKKGG